MSSSNPFDYVNQILLGKKQIIVDDETERNYVPFLTNRSLSYHKDCVVFANEMNLRDHIDKKMQFDFLLNTVRSQKRPFSKWAKSETSEDLECVQKYFGFSSIKAKDAMRILSVDQIKEIRNKFDVGGVGKR